MDSSNKPPRRKTNIEVRDREFLTETEVEQLITAAKKYNRNGLRDATMISLAFHHALRLGELVNLNWSSVDLHKGTIYIHRLKNGQSNTQYLLPCDTRNLKVIQNKKQHDRCIFVSERKTPLSGSGFYKIIKRLTERAKLTIKAHPHMLRHACGYKLANAKDCNMRIVQNYLGHKDIHHTVRYTKLGANQFENLWR